MNTFFPTTIPTLQMTLILNSAVPRANGPNRLVRLESQEVHGQLQTLALCTTLYIDGEAPVGLSQAKR